MGRPLILGVRCESDIMRAVQPVGDGENRAGGDLQRRQREKSRTEEKGQVAHSRELYATPVPAFHGTPRKG